MPTNIKVHYCHVVYNLTPGLFLAGPDEMVKAERWYILGEHFGEWLILQSESSPCQKPREYRDRYCYSYFQEQWKNGCIEFPTFGSQIIGEKDPKCFPGNIQSRLFFLICLKNSKSPDGHVSFCKLISNKRPNCTCPSDLIYLFKGIQLPAEISLTSGLVVTRRWHHHFQNP